MPSTTDDLDRIMAVMACAFDPEFGEAWTRRQVEDALLLGHCHYLLATAQGDPVAPDSDMAMTHGFALTRQIGDEEELLLFAVRPESRGRGIGDRLLVRFAVAASQRGATRLLLEMRRGNPAESLYRRHGFNPVGVRKNYYRTASGPRLDAITFLREPVY